MKVWKVVFEYALDLFVFTVYLLAVIFLFLGAMHWLVEDFGFRVVSRADGAPAPFRKPTRSGRETDPEAAYLGCHVVDKLWVVQLHPRGKYECWDINEQSRKWVGTWGISEGGRVWVKDKPSDSDDAVGYSD